MLVPRVVLCSSMAAVRETQPRSQSSSAILDVTSPVRLVGKIRSRFQASSYNSDSANWPGYEAGGDPLLFCRHLFGKRKDSREEVGTCDSIVSSTPCKDCPKATELKRQLFVPLVVCCFYFFVHSPFSHSSYF